MVTINLTEQNARAFTPTYAEVMAAIEAANQINTQTTSN